MKFSVSIPLLALALGVVAEPTKVLNQVSNVERDLATVTGVLNSVSASVAKLQSAIDAYSSGTGDDILAASKSAQTTINDGVDKVKGTSSLTLTEALGVQAPVQELTTKTQAVVDGLIAKKSALVAGGQGPTTLKTLQDQKTGADALAAAISSKVPPEVGPLATQLSAGISDALQKGIDAFKDAGSAPAGGSSPTSTASSAASSASSTVSAPGSSAAGSAAGSSKPTSKPSASSPPAQYTGAASANTMNSFGAIAAIAAVLAF